MIEIKINLGVTPELANLATKLINAIGESNNQGFGTAPATGIIETKSALQPNKLPPDSAAPTPNPTPAPRRKPKATAKPATTETDPPANTAAPAPAPEQTDTAKAPDQAAQSETPTVEDIRAAMHKTRSRIEGEDYKTNQDGEGYKKYHRALTGYFKQMSAALGSPKPSTLPEDKRAMFISQCDDLDIDATGKIAVNPPF